MVRTLFNDNWYLGTAKKDLLAALSGGAQTTPERVTLPHDAVISKKRSPDAPSANHKGYFPNGIFEYTKTFAAPESWREADVSFLFEGAYMNAAVRINGSFAGQCEHGYAEFIVPANKFLVYGAQNVITVTVSTDRDSRWYSGAGLFRNVWLLVGGRVHTPEGGIRLCTVSADAELAAVEAGITLRNITRATEKVTVVTEFLDSRGDVAACDRYTAAVYGGEDTVIRPRVYIKDPKLWSLDEPNLYTCRVRVLSGETELEANEFSYGVRVLALDPVHGLTVNGKTVKLYGGCIHHDNGIIGAATIARAEERRVELLKAAGYNAIRSAHHPMSRALLDACDKYGMAVMDELSDMWYISKQPQDFSRSFAHRWEKDIEAVVAKDINHACVVMYSIGNEIPDLGGPDGGAISRRLAEKFRSLDPSRYITCAVNGMVSCGDMLAKMIQEMTQSAQATGEINSTMSNLGGGMGALQMSEPIVQATLEAFEALDVAGYNYAEDRYEADAARFTNWISVGSETLPKDIAKNWALVMKNGNVIGDFNWTSWDYIGEAGIGKISYGGGQSVGFYADYPYYLATCGDIDIIGDRRPQSYYREIAIGARRAPYAAVQDPAHYADAPRVINMWQWLETEASWNFPGYEGKPVRVAVYTQADEAELFINGKSAGRKPVPRVSNGEDMAFRAVFDTVYEPGRLEAAAISGGTEAGRFELATPGAPKKIVLRADRSRIRADMTDLAFFELSLTDGAGGLCTASDLSVRVKVEGTGELQGFGSALPDTADCFADGCFRTYHGRALAAVRPTGSGTIRLIAEADGFEPVCAEVTDG